jgi:hypothetical protein
MCALHLDDYTNLIRRHMTHIAEHSPWIFTEGDEEDLKNHIGGEIDMVASKLYAPLYVSTTASERKLI